MAGDAIGRSSAARGIGEGIGVTGAVDGDAGFDFTAAVALGATPPGFASATRDGGGPSARCCSAFGDAAGFGFSSFATAALVTFPAPSTSRRINSEPTAIV